MNSPSHREFKMLNGTALTVHKLLNYQMNSWTNWSGRNVCFFLVESEVVGVGFRGIFGDSWSCCLFFTEDMERAAKSAFDIKAVSGCTTPSSTSDKFRDSLISALDDASGFKLRIDGSDESAGLMSTSTIVRLLVLHPCIISAFEISLPSNCAFRLWISSRQDA